MPTTPLAGDRTRRARNPRDLTGARFAEQLRAKQARDAAQAVDIEAIRKEARAEGFNLGWDAAIEWVAREYGLDSDAPSEYGDAQDGVSQ